MTKSYDLIAIGTGTAAAVTANISRSADLTVAVVDNLPYGGTCALRGCDPKKMLVAAAEAMDATARMQDKNVIAGAINIDWSALQQFKRSFTDPVPEKREQGFAEKGIDTYHGKARFTGPTQMKIDDVIIDARYIVIAAGAEPAHLAIDGVEHLLALVRSDADEVFQAIWTESAMVSYLLFALPLPCLGPYFVFAVMANSRQVPCQLARRDDVISALTRVQA